jgi:hypothetical protein
MNMKDLNFFKKVYKFHSIGIFNDNPLEENKIYITHTYKSKVEIQAMCTQLDLEVTLKKLKKKIIPFNFHEFWNEEVHCKKYPPKKTLMFGQYNLVDPMEL